MAYLKVYQKWLPYAILSDKRAFISKCFGNGHTGIDSVANVYANKVCAVIDGKVLKVYTSSTLGKVVEYGNDKVKIAYYHLASQAVKVDDKVIAGKTVIGVEGSTGSLSKGKHLHTSMWVDGVLVDPEPYLNGSRDFPTEKKEERKYMIRKVTKVLNLRSSRSLANSSNIVYNNMPVGTVFLVTEVVSEGGVVWGHIYVTISGKSYSGWANIATTWSKEV